MDMIILVVNAIIRKGNKVLLGRRDSNSKHFPNYWSIPGGRVEKNEDLIVAVKREIKEETGLDIKINKLLNVSKSTSSGITLALFDFEAFPISSELKTLEKLVELKWFGKKEIKNLRITQRDKKILEKYW